MIAPANKPAEQLEPAATEVIYAQSIRRSSSSGQVQAYQSCNSINNILNPRPQESDSSDNTSWNFDSPFTHFVVGPSHQRALSQVQARPPNEPAHVSPQASGVQIAGEPSPSESSPYTEPWPPSITKTQQATYRFQQTSPSQSGASPPEYSNSPPLYGNSALGVVSGQYIPSAHLTPNTTNMSYSASPSIGQRASPEPPNVIQGNFPMNFNTVAQNSAWGPTELMHGNQDMPMLDIDWSEWDRLFPIEMNNGELDVPRNTQPVI